MAAPPSSTTEVASESAPPITYSSSTSPPNDEIGSIVNSIPIHDMTNLRLDGSDSIPSAHSIPKPSPAHPSTPTSTSTSTTAIPLPFSLQPTSIYRTNLIALASMNVANLSSSELVFKARLAQQAERYDEMAYFMRILILQKSSGVLTNEERGLFAVSYKKLLSSRRMGWRYIYSIEMKEKAATRKLEAEMNREIEKEKEARERNELEHQQQQQQQQSSSSAAVDSKPNTPTATSSNPSLATASSSSSSSTSTSSTSTSLPSVSPTLQSLQARLATLNTNLQHIHSYRYQLFYESSLLISEASSLLLDRLLPNLLTPHAQSEDIFNRWIPLLIDQCIQWERKRTGRPKQAAAAAAAAAVAGGTNLPSAKEKSNALPSTAFDPSTTTLLTALPVAPNATAASQANPHILTKLDTSRHWSLENEFELQLRALDERTRFLSTLRSAHAESLVFYCKMMGDHRRLLAEFLAERDYEETERANQSLQALAWYVLARFVSQSTLTPSHPIRLGLHLNFSIFYYEVLAKPDRACQMASQTYDLALNDWQTRQSQSQSQSSLTSAVGGGVNSTGSVSNSNVNSNGTNPIGPNGSNSSCNTNGGSSMVDGTAAPTTTATSNSSYKDSLLIMQLLKNNLTMWAQSL